ncbi:protein asteroid isoform X1 [Prorops nasuta]|uniref:protein asteroid isoform X1 n=1 Tax=Prorops nasuta TaxID=863751 RepID=UPI0034CED484
MGITGLSKYIERNSDRFFEKFQLHDTYLVIDGNSIACQLYNWYTKCNCAFGGDYDKYAQCVQQFFETLLQCNVIPLVLFDGGREDKKIKTALKRTRHKIQLASRFNPQQRHLKIIPAFINIVFQDVLELLGLRYAKTMFEADNTIAAIAKLLNCPVLSYDSDFYIYGSLYIPFNTLERNICRSKSELMAYQCCKIFRVEKFLKAFHGLDSSLLPLAAVILGNDYVPITTFNYFFRHITVPKSNKNKNERQCRIEGIFKWLSQYNLNSAITVVLSRLQKEKRDKILTIIESIINSYNESTINILIPLGFSEEYIKELNFNYVGSLYKFNRNIHIPQLITDDNEFSKENNNDHCEDKIEDDKDEFEDKDDEGNETIVDIITIKLYICPIQIEDYSQPSSFCISFGILAVIYSIISKSENSPLVCIARDVGMQLNRYQIIKLKDICEIKLPNICSLLSTPSNEKKAILENTLGVFLNNKFLEEIPSEWALYFATVKYWIHHNNTIFNCHVYAVLVSLLFNIIDTKIGFYRKTSKFLSKYKLKIDKILSEKRNINYESDSSTDITILGAFNQIDENDCLVAAQFLLPYFDVDQVLYKNAKKFNYSIVHAFGQLQSCLMQSIGLNALLGHPYKQLRIADVFNGTLLYNLYNNFKQRQDIEKYIKANFQHTPTLLVFFNNLFSKAMSFFEMSNTKKQIRKKKAKTIKNKMIEDETMDSEVEKIIEETDFYDANNRFSLLNIA